MTHKETKFTAYELVYHEMKKVAKLRICSVVHSCSDIVVNQRDLSTGVYLTYLT